MIRAVKSPWLVRGFRLYNRHYLGKSFHRIHLDGDLNLLQGDGRTPMLLCLNHSSWWDLLLGVYLDELLPQWDCYAAMDERQLARYRFFSRLGVIGVDRTRLHGAREFVDHCRELLEGRQRALGITAQGAFTSNTARPVRFQPGIGAIAGKLGAFYVATVVFDYEFWSEKRPEAFLSVRPPERITVDAAFNRRDFVHTLERAMEAHLDSLAARRAPRDPQRFTPLLASNGGISPIYDALRKASARLRGERFVASHEEVVTPSWRSLNHREP